MQYIKTNILLSCNNVGLSFTDKKTKQKKVILADINFKIKDNVSTDRTLGQVISLVGKSGVGKSQLLRMLSGLYIHNAEKTGEILIHHDKVAKQHELTPVKEGDMGIVFQDYYMPECLKIHNMLILAANKNLDFKDDKKIIADAVDSYLHQFELIEHKDKYPIQLSGGQKQRASIIMQLLNGSNFLLMDEPFSGLDPIMIDKTTTLLSKVASSDEFKTLIIVSHDLTNSAAISDTIFVMSKQGREEGTGATIIREIDLLERDLAYHPEIKRMSAFHDTIEEVKSLL
jgi:polar amino acid transport system ATP-binding protein/sulfate transport system ATP-binding protein/NitT/TauT family transport system ATP-binding protein